MSIFDELVARYRNMNYGNLSGNNPSAVRSLLEEYNDRTYAQTINPSELTYLNGVPQNQWIIDDRGNLVFGMPGMEGGLIGSGSTYPTYDPNIDYGDPGYAGFIPGEITGELQQGLIGDVGQMWDMGEAERQIISGQNMAEWQTPWWGMQQASNMMSQMPTSQQFQNPNPILTGIAAAGSMGNMFG